MKKRSLFLALSTSIMLLVAACSNGGNAGNAGGSQPTGQSAPAASAYPEKPIVIVAPSGAGGGWDKTARSITKVLMETQLVEKTITVENKPGGGGAVFLAEYASKDKGNAYKLFVSSPPILINNNKKEGNSPFGYKDVTPLAQLTRDFGAIAVKADSPYADLKSLLDAIKADPTKISMAGGSAPGSMDHLVGVLPAAKYGIDPKAVKYVSYDGGGEAIAALLGGNADAIATDASSLTEYLRAGKIRILGIASDERLGGELKEIPTYKEQGIDASFTIWRGIFGPADMPADAKAYWDEKLKALSENEAWKKELEANGWESEYKDSASFTAFLDEQNNLVIELLTSLGMAK
ncbi:tripartite tricarboxylate transporter substrate binding protein [Brevibacillus composti]|uniref:Tripartite tricarboxylate transporter substrate binding protein n=1 Tax=Brevibacillus composti TaxID=2796470 RepID=A0A7T5ELI9_9BACL|nr:tripartite tricarboxylate transporter substrate binding protein [Brevibacillus composti]QQE74830.1 tripartite tricarboxylate transporter substrate binding protein [Brevibacillus composti]QUO41914.1 tripartite tricarboxylate transporter substrate binding protein [Brevibacillus composti]